MCVCSEWKRSLQSRSPFPLHRRIISPPLRQGRQEVGVYIGLLYPKKAARVEELQSCFCCCRHHHCCTLPRPASCPFPPISCPTHACSLSPSFRGGVGWPGTIEWPSVQQQLGLTAWETGRSCQHPINRTHPALMTHETWKEFSQEKSFRHPL